MATILITNGDEDLAKTHRLSVAGESLNEDGASIDAEFRDGAALLMTLTTGDGEIIVAPGPNANEWDITLAQPRAALQLLPPGLWREWRLVLTRADSSKRLLVDDGIWHHTRAVTGSDS